MSDANDDKFGYIHPVGGKVRFKSPKLGNSHGIQVDAKLSDLNVCIITNYL